jgi:methyl-accepting chemotaxis protein
MFHSIEDVSNTTDRLGQAASETASGVQQITSALSEINRNASETSRLSEAVIDSAERGQNKVQETIQGMGSIRENTSTIADLVHDFRQKTEQIDMIVNVIDDVADETNLWGFPHLSGSS